MYIGLADHLAAAFLHKVNTRTAHCGKEAGRLVAPPGGGACIPKSGRTVSV